MSRHIVLMLVLAPLVSTTFAQPTVAAPPPLPASVTTAGPVVPCESLAGLALPDTVAISATSVPGGSFDPPGPTPPIANLRAFCRVALTVSPQINIEVWLPTDTYNRRFQAVGGGVYAGVISYGAMAAALNGGYATASTDTGHAGSPLSGAFALNPDGTLNWGLIEDFASRSLFELTRKSKTLIETFYGRKPAYSYWNGCSTGGRQGLMLAQRFPKGYDGILAGAPAIHWDRFHPAQLWPQVVMQQELGVPIAQCKLALASQRAVEYCDGRDGFVDGVLDDPRRCDFDPNTLIGTRTDCGEFTEADAQVLQMIWDGPHAADGSFLWHGLTIGTPLNALAGPNPFPVTLEHLRYWVKQDPAFDWKTLGYAGLEQVFHESHAQFGEVIGTDDPDLLAFRRAGGKLLLWHGWNDQLIFPEGTITYYNRVIRTFHSQTLVQRFARLFMAPGVLHCAGGTGPTVPGTFDMFSALVQWVENGRAPDRIIAAQLAADGSLVRTRPLCSYPLVARYNGQDDPNSADSFRCKPNFGHWGTSD
jgi:hypothetical protein